MTDDRPRKARVRCASAPRTYAAAQAQVRSARSEEARGARCGARSRAARAGASGAARGAGG
jgi:hypothetical protein